MILLFILDSLLIAAPVVLYLYKHNRDKEHNHSVLSMVLLVSGILYAVPFLDFGFGHVVMLLLAIGARLVLYPLHWIAWILATVKKYDVKTRVLPLLTVWMLLLAHGLTLESPTVLTAAALYILAAALLYKSPAPQVSDPESAEVSAEK